MSRKNRILIAATKSGSGKTLFTCGLLTLLKKYYHTDTMEKAGNEGSAADRRTGDGQTGAAFPVTAYKCGPDYIDPMFHKRVLGIPGTNMDPFFSDEADLKQILLEDGAKISVIEGAMGIYDGITGLGKTGSCYEVAVKTHTPILLLIDAQGMGATILSLLKGILLDDEEKRIAGIVFNRMSNAYLKSLEPAVNRLFSNLGRDIRIIGAVPKVNDVTVESRHLGLMMPDEISDIEKKITSFAETIGQNIDMEALLSVAENAEEIEAESTEKKEQTPEQPKKTPVNGKPLKLAVAKDEAFCFYYQQNLKALTAAGAELVYFSPLHDKTLPAGITGILLGGGYPELYLKELSENESMKESIRKALSEGMPSLAECGGFMYLGDYIEENGEKLPMVGAYQGGSSNRGKLMRFGYITLHPCKEGLLDGPVRGHEFHYYDSENCGTDCRAVKPGSGREWLAVHMGPAKLWGYPHLYYPSLPGFASRFVKKMEEYANGTFVPFF